jgi:hypothetical protein
MGASKVGPCLEDCTINTYGFNLRQGQVLRSSSIAAGDLWAVLGTNSCLRTIAWWRLARLLARRRWHFPGESLGFAQSTGLI